MLKNKVRDRLFSNWDKERVESLSVRAEVKYHDEVSGWACYVIAMSPEDEDTIACIIHGFTVELTEWSMREVMKIYNEYGDMVEIDKEFKPICALTLLKRLKGEYEGQRY